MFGLRQKLAFGFGGLLLLLLVVSGLGVAVLAQYRGQLDRFFYENWRSVEDGQHVIEAVNRLDAIAQPLGARPAVGDVAAAAAQAVAPLALGDSNVSAEDHNITLAGEAKVAAELTRAWNGRSIDGNLLTHDSYRDALNALLDPKVQAAARTTAAASLTRFSRQVRENAQIVIDLNLKNMRPIDGRAKELADKATLLMVALAAAGTALAIVFTILVARSILKPLSTIIQSIHEIEQGNLDLVVQVKSRDELRQLAEAFNSMTAKLREYRRTNRAKLIRTQQTTQLAVNSLPDAIAVTGPDGSIELSNATAQNLFGLAPGATVTETADRRLVDVYREVVRTGSPSQPRGYESAVEVYDAGGQLRFYLPHAVPILDGESHAVGVTLVLADVTNLRRLDEMKSGLLSVVSHELKTPLTSIRMAVHLLLEERVGSLTPKQGELLTAAREDSDRLEKIIAGLLDMGRLESGKANLQLKPIRVDQLIDASTSPLAGLFQDRGISLDISTPLDLPEVVVDETRIGHVFSNLLTNAAKYTDPGGHVRMSAEARGDAVRFTISDTGIGIPVEHQARVFDRFFRVQSPARGNEAGAGLGLAIAREIVRAHGSDIELSSTPGQGSTFSFDLRTAPIGSQTNQLNTVGAR